ncbi:MAG: rcdA [Hydrocarboniphaga sp.]|uniref:glycosyltransferase n=1 Tax=Hydrocarboniphaga sp. TaxID=2033016 RepID=UPI00260328B8|nr:glycosyltransferase [Hydrocarboniphaga sp.]MDB5969089.1 rcdA [Hydrocarboniphaga sp.]
MDTMVVLAPVMLVAGLLFAVFGLRQARWVPQMHDENRRLRPWLFGGLGLLLARYVIWRLTQTLPPFGFSVAGLWPYLFLLFEISSVVMTVITYLTLSRHTNRTHEVEAALPALRARPPYRIALLIPTYNEPLVVLERTILGSLVQDYPDVRVWVLDDSRRDWLRDYCAEAGVGYGTRTDNAGAKAGNMNAGLATIRASGFEPDFLGVLDADFVPTSSFIRRCLALHLVHPEAGIVQTPQHFFNPDPIQMNLALSGLAPDEQRFFFDELLPGRDGWGTAFCCGTSSVIRTAAVDAINGFPMDSVTEDMLMSMRMREAGYQTLYLNEPLTTGLAPEGLGEYIVQRHRWCLGLMQIVRDHYNPFSRRHRLKLMDRVHLFDTFMYWAFSFPTRYVFMAAPVIYWTTGMLVIEADFPSMLYYMAPWLVLHMTAMTWITRGSLQPVLNDVTQLLIAPAAIHATFTGLFSNEKHKFKVTPKGLTGTEISIDWRALSPVLAFLLLNLLGLLLALTPQFQPQLDPAPRLVNLFWIIVNVLVLSLTAAACVELPRQRTQERFASAGTRAWLVLGRSKLPVELRDLSFGGCSLALDVALADSGSATAAVTLMFSPGETYQVLRMRSRIVNGHSVLGCRFVSLSLEQQQSLVLRIYGGGKGRLLHGNDTLGLVSTMFRRLFNAGP